MELYFHLVGPMIYLFKSTVRLLGLRGSRLWPIQPAKVASVNCWKKLGGSVVELIYVYTVEGSIYSNVDEIPFLSKHSAKKYASRFEKGEKLMVRRKPSQPAISVVREDDQAMSLTKP